MMTAKLRLEPLTSEHAIAINPVRRDEMAFVCRALEEVDNHHLSAWAFTIGTAVVCILGLVHHWPGRATAWAVMGKGSGPVLFQIAKQCSAALDRVSEHRVELDVRADYLNGQRFAALMGFEPEAVLSDYYPDRCDAVLFARIR